ncbi:Prostaglandin reductase 2 [Hondaea fermentalgiana]|uniref:Prostaglandin reductase 2 n=1 Tax=Hondaea fermentalgiana TaxID=2315210 RepID=A0A2R5G5W3_9STRA|nr:Prostaglandin reductase 2 [Hondaea fermentalgiana]|eukprot:GBG25925.1 Prostaglandin reductase 2 [Hondaea fermentalgiana]
MSAETGTNCEVRLAKRPGKDESVAGDDFEVVKSEVQEVRDDLEDGEVKLEVLVVSVDPYMRCRFNESTGADYMGPFVPGKAICSGGAATVLESKHPGFAKGDVLVSQMFMPWKRVCVLRPDDLSDAIKLPEGADPMMSVGPLGMPGLSAWFGVEQSKPIEGELCVLSSCAGGVGSVAGQVFRQRGLRVIGICGSQEKASWSQELGIADVALSYRDPDFDAKLKDACDGKVDLYFDNVGGTISEKVIMQLKKGGRVIVCGQISSYNQDTTRDDYVYPDPLPAPVAQHLESLGGTRERFFVGWYTEKNVEALREMQKQQSEGTLKAPISWVHGLENAGTAFCDMMAGKHMGKVLVDCRPRAQ